MSYIHSIIIDNDQYLIEPLLYSNATVLNGVYQITITNYVPFDGSILLITVPSNNIANAQLSINNETPIQLYYDDSQIPANLLKAGYTYILSYHNENNSSKWNILNHIEEPQSLSTTGGLEYNLNGELGIKNGGISDTMIPDNTISNIKLQNYTITIAGQSIELGDSITLADLGLSTAMHFIGHVDSESQYTPSDGHNEVPMISGLNSYTPSAGDVVIDKLDNREYVYSSGETWELLGQDASTTLDSDDETATLSSDNTWISRIQQNSDRTISVERTTLNTSGTWTGNANSLTTPHEIYVNLETEQNNNNPVTFNGTSDIAIGVNGILPITHGGTGADNSKWHLNGIVYGAQTSGAVPVPYYEAAQAALLESIVSIENGHHYTTLELGNDKAITDPTDPHSEGRLILYSAGTEAHILQGDYTEHNGGYTHYLINGDGYLLQKPDLNNAIGSNTQPVYIAQNGTITALTYTPNRLYYSASSASFEATNHYATTNAIAINNNSITSDYTFEVNGKTNLLDDLNITGNGNITGILTITNTTDITTGQNATEGALIVSGGATIRKKVNIEDNTNIDGILNVVGNTTIGGTLGITGNTTIGANGTTSTLTVWGATSLKSTLNVLNAVTFEDTLEVTGASTLTGNVGIGAAPNNTYQLYVEGNSQFKGNIVPQANQKYSLGEGTTPLRWSSIYVGSKNSYGDTYTPIYWNNGVPEEVRTIQQANFTITNSGADAGTATISTNTSANSMVVEIVVKEDSNSHISNLQSPITWGVNNGTIVLSATVGGRIDGYVLYTK